MLDINPKTRVKMDDIKDDIWLKGTKREYFINNIQHFRIEKIKTTRTHQIKNYIEHDNKKKGARKEEVQNI
jgi:hypothetical protein